jgi:hypothetical protein
MFISCDVYGKSCIGTVECIAFTIKEIKGLEGPGMLRRTTVFITIASAYCEQFQEIERRPL